VNTQGDQQSGAAAEARKGSSRGRKGTKRLAPTGRGPNGSSHPREGDLTGPRPKTKHKGRQGNAAQRNR
jgi:hypothetical protein